MQRETFQTKSGMGPCGLRRDTQGPTDIFSLMGEIHAFLTRTGRSRHDPGYYLKGPLLGLEDALSGDRRNCDRIISNPDRYTHESYVADARNHGTEHTNRLVVDATLTSSGNLVVSYAPYFLEDDGSWVKAPEWKDLSPRYRSSAFERGDHELLFMKGVEDLTRDLDDSTLTAVSIEERSLAARAAVAAYRRTVTELHRSFTVQENCSLVALYRDSPNGKLCVGVEVVDGHAEHTARVLATAERFSETTGLDPVAFMEACAGADPIADHNLSEKLSRRYRKRGSASADMTPGVTLGWIREFRRAKRYGFLELEQASDETPADPGIIPGAR